MTAQRQMTPLLSRRQTLFGAGALALSARLASIPLVANAQDVTPAVDGGVEIEGAPGVWAEVFAGAPTDRLADHTIYTVRFTFFPGSEIFLHRHPGSTFLASDAGTFGWTLGRGVVHVVRGAKLGETAVEDVSEPEAVITLEPGDAMYYDDDVAHWAHNSGDEPVSLLSTMVLTADEPLLIPVDESELAS